MKDNGIQRSPEVNRFFPRLIDRQAEDTIALAVEEGHRGTTVTHDMMFEPVQRQSIVITVVQQRPIRRTLRGNLSVYQQRKNQR